jgi:hypothetical protein
MEKAPCNGAFGSALFPASMRSDVNRDWNASTTSSRRKVPRRRYARSGAWERVCAGRCAPHPRVERRPFVDLGTRGLVSIQGSALEGATMSQRIPIGRMRIEGRKQDVALVSFAPIEFDPGIASHERARLCAPLRDVRVGG